MISALPHAPELEKYELKEEIGHGGMATVYRAADRRLGREVAVKLIHRHLRENPQVAARFVAEARAVARLRHPNIVEVYDISETDEPERYLVVELVRGPTLRALMTRYGALPPEIVAAIGLELCDALAHAHAEGVIHRDVKPENVLISVPSEGGGSDSGKPRVKLTDFGIAKLLDAQGVTSTGQVLGSPAHMAPEQIEGGDVDARSDLFALGVLMYEGMTGRLPFDGKNPAQVLRCVLDGIYVPADRVHPPVGGRWSRVLDRALARNPSARPADVEEFAGELRSALAQVGIDSPSVELQAFFESPEEYLEEFPRKIGGALLEAGSVARKAGNVPVANSLLNRALVYLPGDAEVLRHVSGLAARKRLYAAMRWAASLALVAGVVTGGVVASRSIELPEPIATPTSPPTPRAKVAPPPAPTVAAQPSAVAVERPVAPTVPKRRKRPVLLPPPGSAAPVGPPRQVSVRITGATGGHLRIDGQEKPWFGEVHELSLGEHLFEFVPPNDACCVATSRRVLIKEGPGIQQVVGDISFKPAVLRVPSSLEGTARMACPTVFFGDFTVPGSRNVPMSRAEITERCTITPDNKASAPVQKLVTLRAGQTTVIPWP